ncbi:hypothetical protein IFM89_011214 [Coptis chinensis]|uniref:Aminotransferase-like plant mobile domain-containing protein n=1 Tax=Coptis chinensis TaxID=261450 RepID=A0A835HJ68_9MAGN|nr:hypothetical protein IFM89_011214 [Coptis chinensis]
MDSRKTHCVEVEAENSEIHMDVNETENVDGGYSSHLVAMDGNGDNNDGEGMEEDVDNDGENESDGDQSKEMEEAKTLLLEVLGLEKKLNDKVMPGTTTQIKLEVLKKHLAEKVKDPKEEGDGKEDNEKGKGKGKKKKKKTDEGSSEEEIERAVRGYLLFFFGCTMFCDQSGVFVLVVYLKALMKFKDRISKILLRGSNAWIYEHFPMFSLPLNMNYVNTLSHVMRWANGMSTYLDPLGALKHFRLMMDKMTRHDVIWNPYGKVRGVCPLEDITFYSGGICFFNINENVIVNEIGCLLEVGMSSGGGEIRPEKREYFQRALALT